MNPFVLFADYVKEDSLKFVREGTKAKKNGHRIMGDLLDCGVCAILVNELTSTLRVVSKKTLSGENSAEGAES